jgi:diguanylate cyclase
MPAGMREKDRRVVGVALAGSGLLLAVYLTVGSPMVRETAWTALVAGVTAALVAGIRRHRPPRPGPWWVLVLGLGLFTTANLLTHPLWGAVPGMVTVGLALELVAFSLLGVASVGMVRRQRPSGDREGTLDGAIVLVALATVLSGTVFSADSLPASPALAQALLVVAPVLLAGVAAAAARLLFVGTRATSITLLAGSAVLALAGHVLRTVTESAGTYARGGWEDLAIGLAYASVGLAALHPSMVRMTMPSTTGRGGLNPVRLAILGAALTTPPIILLVQARAAVVPLVASVLVSLLVLWRLGELVMERERVRDQLERLAGADGLTGLPNRSLLLTRLGEALRRERPDGAVTAVLFIDLDDFKGINDDFGHRVGDETLQAVSRRLTERLRRGDLLGRLSGDEFVVVCDGVETDDVPGLAARALEAFARPFSLTTVDVTLGASIGVATSATCGATPEQLLHEADAAMYEAKQRGDGTIEVYGEALGARLHRRRRIELDLPPAVRAGELTLVYQPIHDLHPRGARGSLGPAPPASTCGVEALVRWTHPQLGPISPGELIPIADATGAILDLGEWVLREACGQVARWRAAGVLPRGFRLFVNLSPRQLHSDRLVAQVTAALWDAGIRVEDLVLEVTETAVLDEQIAVGTLHALRAHGIAVALDDFGTGYSSLTHLKHLPIDMIKIDASFVRDLCTSADDQAIVRAIVSIARQRGAAVVGEGVEDADQHAVLRRLGCDLAQGYHLGRPVPAAEIGLSAVEAAHG